MRAASTGIVAVAAAARSLVLRALPFLVGMPAALAVLPGCTTTVAPTPTAVIVPTESTGTLVIDWTIQLRTDPGDCVLAGANAIQIHVITSSFLDAGTFQQTCGAFSTSIALTPGEYQASALLVDGAGQPRTTSVAIQPFTLLGGDLLQIPIDFPANSFF